MFSDMLASGFGSLGLMTSVLVSPDGFINAIGERLTHKVGAGLALL